MNPENLRTEEGGVVELVGEAAEITVRVETGRKKRCCSSREQKKGVLGIITDEKEECSRNISADRQYRVTSEASRKLDSAGPPRIRNFHSGTSLNLRRYLARTASYQGRPIRLW